MMTLPDTLPDDIDELKAFIESQNAIIQRQAAALSDLEQKLLWSEEKYRAMELRYFGRKSEKYTPAEDKQNRLFDEAELYSNDDSSGIEEKVPIAAHNRKKRGRKPKSDNLPVIEQIHEVPSEERSCPCCGTSRPEIGEDRTSEYDLVPAHVVKIVHVIKKYGPCSCQQFSSSLEKPVIAAKGPDKIVKGSDFTNRTIAFFMTAKFSDAIPFYRMAKMLDRSGLIVSRATLCNLTMSVGRALGDLLEILNRDIACSPVLLMDETTVQVLKEGVGPPGKKSYMWVVRGYYEGKPIHRFAYHANRSGTFADTLLSGFSGYLQTDGYSGYDHLDAQQNIMHVGCFAHIRRKFVEAWETAGKTGIAKEALDTIARVYAVESELRKKLIEHLLDERQFVSTRKERLVPLFSTLRSWLMESALKVAPMSSLGKAIAYAQKVFDRAIRFVDHGLLTPDTNAVENAIRPFVVGRKNWLFSGSPGGAHASAGFYSLIETAKANGHEPYGYLCYVFDTLPRCQTTEEKQALVPYRLDPSSYKSNGV
jgi:transposase